MIYYCLVGSDSLFFLSLNRPAEGTKSPVVGVVPDVGTAN